MTHFTILINSRKNLKEMNLTLKLDTLDKYDKFIKKLRRENLKKISKNRAVKFFDSGVPFC